MELSYAFLAKGADFNPDGTLSLLGADLSILRADIFPYAADSLMLVMKIKFAPEEANRQYQVGVDVFDPRGHRLNEDTAFPLTPDPPEVPGLPYVGKFILNFAGAQFSTPGTYTIVMKLENNEIARLPLCLVPAQQELPAPAPVRSSQPGGAIT